MKGIFYLNARAAGTGTAVGSGSGMFLLEASSGKNVDKCNPAFFCSRLWLGTQCCSNGDREFTIRVKLYRQNQEPVS